MNREYRRKLEKLQKKEYNVFVKKNKNFLDAIKGDQGSQQAMQRIKELLDNYGKEQSNRDTIQEEV
jgi:hypothetical protein